MDNQNKDLFENKSISRAVWTLALPTIASMLVTLFYNLADTFFVGQTNDPLQVAAVSLAMPVFLILMGIGNLFGIGGSSVISRYLGEQKAESIKNVSSFCFYSSIISGIIIGVVSIIFMDNIIPLTGATEGTYQFVKEYLTYIAIGAPFIIVSSAFGNIVRSIGLAKKAMIGMMIGTIINIVLDPIMILYMDMGVVGAAAATVIGNIASAIYYVCLLQSKENLLSIKLKDFKFNVIGEVFKIGVPAALSNILMSFAQIIYNVFLSGYGEAPIAAMGIALKVSFMLIMFYLGLTMGAQPLIGYNYGAKNYERMKRVITYISGVAVTFGIISTAFLIFFAEPIIKAFINDAEVIAYGTKMLKIQVSTGPILGLMFVAMASLQSMGKGVASLILSVCRQGLVFLPVAFITNVVFGLDGLMWSQPVADLASIILSMALLIITLNKLKSPATDNIPEPKMVPVIE